MRRVIGTCVWCGRWPLTKEHVIPQWIRPHLPRGNIKVIQELGEPEDEGYRLIEHPWSRFLTLQAKCVCKDCNEVWHNKIDKLARPRLRDMIEGDDVGLTWDEQLFISRWAIRTAVMFAYVHQPTVYLPRHWRRALYPNMLPPAGAFVYLGQYNGDPPIWSWDYSRSMAYPEGLTVDVDGVYREDYFLTIGIKHFMLQVAIFGMNSARLRPTLWPSGPLQNWLVPVWPARPDAPVLWPPRDVMTQSILRLFATRFDLQPLSEQKRLEAEARLAQLERDIGRR